ncbi:MAG: hypothetical protein V2I33_04150 [Kangiellaceae bacterium]|jgi:septal ring factor EnvC (AmiA/AmiB activator)|nr:hypothetical protein [Kangiellaceae bacterium]
MAKHCSGCKREISWGNKDCPFCGSSHSSVFNSIKVLVVPAVVAMSSAAATYWYSEQLNNQKSEALATELQQVKQQLIDQEVKLQKEIDTLNEEVAAANEAKRTNSSALAEQNKLLQQQLEASSQEIAKQKGRAGWLGRENRRLSNELTALKRANESLTAKVNKTNQTAAQTTQSPNSTAQSAEVIPNINNPNTSNQQPETDEQAPAKKEDDN